MNKSVVVFPFIILSLLAAIWSGWIRIGWNFPITNIAAQHGALMVNSFLASLIFLERAVTFRNKWVILLPLLNASSVIAFAFNLPLVAQMVFIGGSAGFVLMCLYFIYKFKEASNYIFLIGALSLLIGNSILYKINFYPSAVTWWMGFLLFTIVAERLELSRFLALTNFRRNLLWFCVAMVAIGLVWPFHSGGNIIFSIAIASTAAWLLKYDMARHSIKVKGQHRYSGLLLIIGYVWLLVTAVLLPFQNHFAFGYDAVLHSFFIGFSHAVIILPAITKMPVKIFRPFLYVWFCLMQASLMVRIIADMFADVICRKIGGVFNGISILLFFVSIAAIMVAEIKNRNRVTTAVKNNLIAHV